MIVKETKLSYTPSEFAKLMGVSDGTVRQWLARGEVPGAYQQGDGVITIKRWRIPHEALKMERKRRGAPGGPRPRYHSKKDQIRELKTELADLHERHIALLEKYAGATGRVVKLEEELELAEAHIKTLTGSLAAEEHNYEMYRKLYLEVKAKYDQLALTSGGLTPSKEELCQGKRIASNSTPSTDSTRPSESVSGVEKLQER